MEVCMSIFSNTGAPNVKEAELGPSNFYFGGIGKWA